MRGNHTLMFLSFSFSLTFPSLQTMNPVSRKTHIWHFSYSFKGVKDTLQNPIMDTQQLCRHSVKNCPSPGQVAELVRALSPTPKVVGSIPGWSRYLGCRYDPRSEHVWETTNHCFSLTLMFLFLSSSPSKINKYVLKWGLKKKRIALEYLSSVDCSAVASHHPHDITDEINSGAAECPAS